MTGGRQDKHTDPEQGRERIEQRDREADSGERVEEYREGSWSQPGDPADQRRKEAIEGPAEVPDDSPGDPGRP
jgi:hypothetical protein